MQTCGYSSQLVKPTTLQLVHCYRLGCVKDTPLSERNQMCVNGLRWVGGCTGQDPPSWHPSLDPVAWQGPWWLGEFCCSEWPEQCFDVRKALSVLHSMCLLNGSCPYKRGSSALVRSFSSFCRVSSHPPHQWNWWEASLVHPTTQPCNR